MCHRTKHGREQEQKHTGLARVLAMEDVLARREGSEGLEYGSVTVYVGGVPILNASVVDAELTGP